MSDLPSNFYPAQLFFCFADVEEDHYARKDPTYLWRDLLQVHATFPIHVLVGGGDQVYSDPVWQESTKLQEWSAYKTM